MTFSFPIFPVFKCQMLPLCFEDKITSCVMLDSCFEEAAWGKCGGILIRIWLTADFSSHKKDTGTPLPNVLALALLPRMSVCHR